MASAKPRITPIGSLSRSQRETCATSGVSTSGSKRVADHLAAALDPPGAPGRALEDRGGAVAVVLGEQAGVTEDRLHLGLLHLLVLGRERVDRGRDDRDRRLAVAAAFGHVGNAREDAGVDGGDVGGEEIPAFPAALVVVVGADVAAPDHGAPGADDVRDQARGLGIVKEDDVARPERGEHGLGVGPADALEGLALGLAQRPAVPVLAVQAVVQPLGQGEELRRAGDRQPAHRDVEPAREPDPGPEHLGDAAPGRGRVDVPELAPGEQRVRLSQPGFQLGPVSGRDQFRIRSSESGGTCTSRTVAMASSRVPPPGSRGQTTRSRRLGMPTPRRCSGSVPASRRGRGPPARSRRGTLRA